MKIRERIFIASFSENFIEKARQYNIGFESNHFCISNNLNEENIEKSINLLLVDEKRVEKKCEILHAPFTELVVAAIDDKARKLVFERLEETYRVCQRVGIRKMVVHSTYLPPLYHKSWHIQKSVDFWKKFMADKEDLTVYIENVLEDEPYMMKEIIDGIALDNVKLCLDIGHSNVMVKNSYEIVEWIELLGNRIGHFHIHNNFGDKDIHSDISDGSCDFENIFDAISKYCSKDVTFTVESREDITGISWLIKRLKQLY